MLKYELALASNSTEIDFNNQSLYLPGVDLSLIKE